MDKERLKKLLELKEDDPLVQTEFLQSGERQGDEVSSLEVLIQNHIRRSLGTHLTARLLNKPGGVIDQDIGATVCKDLSKTLGFPVIYMRTHMTMDYVVHIHMTLHPPGRKISTTIKVEF